MKYHLRRVFAQMKLTYEEFSTIIFQMEGCLNSRPLTLILTDPTDLEVLTPGHFLIDDSLQAIPDPDLAHLPMSRLTKWQLLKKLNKMSKTLQEYLLVKSDAIFSASWPMDSHPDTPRQTGQPYQGRNFSNQGRRN